MTTRSLTPDEVTDLIAWLLDSLDDQGIIADISATGSELTLDVKKEMA